MSMAHSSTAHSQYPRSVHFSSLFPLQLRNSVEITQLAPTWMPCLRILPLPAAHPGPSSWPLSVSCCSLDCSLAAAPPQICLHKLHQQLGLLLLGRHLFLLLLLLLLLERGQAELGQAVQEQAVQGKAGHWPKTS